MKREKAVVALLVDKFGLRPWEISQLTERQIVEIYWHPRDKDGEIKFPMEIIIKPEKVHIKSYENDLKALREFAREVRLPKKKLATLEKQLAVKYGRSNY